MNQRAFNLFTALVSFVMILLAVILTNSMTQTEDKAIATLGELEQQSEIQAVADLARGDALQVFIYNLRYGMESWITKEDNWFPLESGKKWNGADGIVESYIRINFGGDCVPDPGQSDGCARDASGNKRIRGQQFAFFVTKQLSGVLAVGSSFGRYSIELKQDDAAMLQALNATIVNSTTAPGGQQFFELLKCNCPAGNANCDSPPADDCPIGTFYVNLDLGKGAFAADPIADDQMYESLPKIVVRRIGTSQTLETRILPRSKIKIYVPIRIFKAVAGAKKIADAHVFQSGGTNSVHEKLLALKLGICDPGKCQPRNGDVFLEAARTDWSNACPKTPELWLTNYDPKVEDRTAHIDYINEDYKPALSSSMQEAMSKIIAKLICDPTIGVLPQFQGVLPQGIALGNGDCHITLGRGTPNDSKKIRRGDNTNNNPPDCQANPSLCDTLNAQCFSASRMDFQLKYYEQDPLYMVSNPTLTGGTRAPYTIQISDDFAAPPGGGGPPSETCKTSCQEVPPSNCIQARCEPA